MIAGTLPGGHAAGLGATHRSDRWWLGPTLTFCGLLAFVPYATWAGAQGRYYYAEPYLSPMYAPAILTNPAAPGGISPEHAWLGAFPRWWTGLSEGVHGAFSWLPDWFLTPFSVASPAMLILIFPLAFRLTCYYYRKAYYRSFALTPPACAVAGVRAGKYHGETKWLLFQNLHRIAMYFAVAFVFILTWDAIVSFFKHGQFGIGVGSLVQSVNAYLLAGYTFGCHSFRHLIGGRRNDWSCDGRASLSHKLWAGCSQLNARHMLWAWMSLFWVGFTDFYIRMVSMGIWTDINTWD